MKSSEQRIAKLDLIEIIEKTIDNCASDIDPLVQYLQMETSSDAINKDKAIKIEQELRAAGSNDIASLLRGFEYVKYDEIVYDVGKKLKANVDSDRKAFENEKEIITKIFSDTLDKMSVEEKKELFKSMGISSQDIPLGKTGLLITQALLKNYGGFVIYKSSLIVANAIARQVLGRGLSLATNAMIARGISVFTGPIGWVLTGLWLLVDIAGPAYRKTVPTVIYIAALRLMLQYRINIGVVGDGSTGKDALIKNVFNINTGNINPIAGSTSSKEIYPLGSHGAFITNFPGFNDYRPKVDKELDEYIQHMDAFILLVDISRGVTNTDVEIFEKVKSFGKPTVVCLNKVDLPRTNKEREALIKAAKTRIKASQFYETVFDPDPRLSGSKLQGCKEVYDWVCQQIEGDDKDATDIPKGNF